ncbi:hypothetical protein PLICRDRAFT_46825 [Plicaturopsis crispa FD-325 SS-3]|uniref:Unplaced genomic scaffold PLICRscaffold_20, whole genome shotgun sequence n=1 Tax=Plicaturopsis crispa FD-325 SS-3 TaxID=944288 RepID=A0A0C9T3V9_PLICR|nr:hypothetical protein PLICRDRAFT_46825 [Plicaturopsis crispa FD-325 SS-3]
MQRSSSDSTTSPAPISPFSSYSNASEATSDELPDLGAFTTVFRALGHFHQPRAPFVLPTTTSATHDPSATPDPASSVLFSPSETPDSDAQDGSTVWNRRPIASYLESYTADSSSSHSSSSPPSSNSGSHTEGEQDQPDGVDREHLEQLNEKAPSTDADAEAEASLGYLDGVLSFLAEERARFTAERERTDESAWRHVVEPRRKRRRRRSRTATSSTASATRGKHANDTDEDDSDSSPSPSPSRSSSPEPNAYKSTPATPPHRPSTLAHSRSTPSLRPSSSTTIDPRVIALRKLAHKLRMLFPADAASLNGVLAQSGSEFDPRGRVPKREDTLIHVFIDHSNILIGFLSHLKRVRHPFPTTSAKLRHLKQQLHMSHAALALILERGRPITRRVLVASSPLYQPMDEAERLGYEVRVYARVPDTGGGQDREREREGGRRRGVHRKKTSVGGNSNTSTDDSSGAQAQALSRSLAASARHSSAVTPTGNHSSSSNNNTSNTSPGTTARIRYREQGVDELLQLKLHQALADVDGVPPTNATIVLATGDGNVGQFNDDGFLGPVRTALKRGWRVELYAWEEGLSRAWMREFGEGPWRDRFRVIGMEAFAADLLDI